MSTQITSANTNSLSGGARNLVRSSTGILYAVILDTTDGGIEVWKGGTDGSSWTEQDTSNNPQNTNYLAPACEIGEDDIIYIGYYHINTGHGGALEIRHVLFHTADAAINPDTFQGDESAVTLNANPNTKYLSIGVDSENNPHMTYINIFGNMGIDYDTVDYVEKTTGSWGTRLQVEGSTNERQCRQPDISFSIDGDLPIITYINETDSDLGSARGNANPATSFTLHDIASSVKTGVNSTPIFACDSEGNEYVTYIDSTDDLNIVKHLVDDAWTTWQTPTTLDSTNNLQNPTLFIDDTDTYVFAEDSGDNDLYSYKNTDSRTTLETGTYQNIKAGWSLFRDGFRNAVVVQGFVGHSTIQGGSGGSGESQQAAAQSFTTTAAYSLKKITVTMETVGTVTDNVYIDITSGSITGTVEATSDDVTGSTISTTDELVTFTFSSAVSLSANTKYWVRMFRDGARDTVNYYDWGHTASNVDSGGDRYVRHNNAWDPADGSRDMQLLTASLSPTEVPYIFGDGTDIFYNSLSLASAVTQPGYYSVPGSYF